MSTHVACRLWHTFLFSLTKCEQTLCDYNWNDDYCQNTMQMQKHKPLNEDTSKPAHTKRYGRQEYSCTHMNARTFKHIHKTHKHTDTQRCTQCHLQCVHFVWHLFTVDLTLYCLYSFHSVRFHVLVLFKTNVGMFIVFFSVCSLFTHLTVDIFATVFPFSSVSHRSNTKI